MASCLLYTSGQDVQLAPCGFSREGYTFAGWAESSYGSTVKYADGATINRPFEAVSYTHLVYIRKGPRLSRGPKAWDKAGKSPG